MGNAYQFRPETPTTYLRNSRERVEQRRCLDCPTNPDKLHCIYCGTCQPKGKGRCLGCGGDWLIEKEV